MSGRREIEFRIVVEYEGNLNIGFKYYSLCEIMIGLDKLFDTKFCTILSEDRYTGLRDKNGKKIHENDVIHSDTFNEDYEVSFNDGCFSYIISEGEYNYLHELTQDDIKVIGNIYDT